MSQISRKYKLTVILDTRGYDAPVESLQEKVTTMLTELGGEVSAMENLGRQEFIRVTEKDHTGDTFLLVEASGPPNFPGDLQERIRLDKQIKRIMVQSA
jgi:small subunit ribosomal protein S6